MRRSSTFHWVGLAILLGGPLGCDGGSEACGPGLPFSLCGVVEGKPVSYAPPGGVSLTARGQGSVTYSVIGLDGVYLDVWGDGEAWMDANPHPVAGWLLEPPPGFVVDGQWVCGEAGTITHNADDSVDATLTALSVIPQCSAGGSASLQADVFGGVVPFMTVPGCWIDFRANDMPMVIISPSCPQTGVPMALDGTRIIMGQMPDTTACVGTGASLTLFSDTSSTGAHHLTVDIPSMSAPQVCGTTTGAVDYLQMHTAGLRPM